MIYKLSDLTKEKIEIIGNYLKEGKIGVIPTDTIYGIVGAAFLQETVERIYELRKRSKDKPMIILISSLDDLKKFEIVLTKKQKEFLAKNWPNPLSVVLECKNEKYKYLHRGKDSLAFRVPKDKFLQQILNISGSLVAPSANFEGEKPSETIADAKNYFGQNVGLYIDKGKITSSSSTLVMVLEDGAVKILREGAFKGFAS
ncbi:threonylcarbamoyl-AMP synthase [Candidatus Daviesbacteria bacterium]|nr:threonylcarbamoyl-AMP synthase [Candidatus Daviesbacteria bacterium]